MQLPGHEPLRLGQIVCPDRGWRGVGVGQKLGVKLRDMGIVSVLDLSRGYCYDPIPLLCRPRAQR